MSLSSKLLSTPTNRSVHDEEILNVIRESDAGMVDPPELAKELGKSDTTARTYLKDLEDEGRVVGKQFGGQGGSLVYRLAEGERREPVDPKIDRISRACDAIRLGGKYSIALGGTAIGLAVLILIFVAMVDESVIGLSQSTVSQLAAEAIWMAIGGGFIGAAGGVVMYASAVLEYVASVRMGTGVSTLGRRRSR